MRLISAILSINIDSKKTKTCWSRARLSVGPFFHIITHEVALTMCSAQLFNLNFLLCSRQIGNVKKKMKCWPQKWAILIWTFFGWQRFFVGFSSFASFVIYVYCDVLLWQKQWHWETISDLCSSKFMLFSIFGNCS